MKEVGTSQTWGIIATEIGESCTKCNTAMYCCHLTYEILSVFIIKVLNVFSDCFVFFHVNVRTYLHLVSHCERNEYVSKCIFCYVLRLEKGSSTFGDIFPIWFRVYRAKGRI